METEKRSVTLIIAWVLLLVMGLLLTLGAAESMVIAFRGSGDTIAGVPKSSLAQINPDLPKTLLAQRLTAASYALTCGILVAWIAVTAFRKRQKWSWYALLCSVGLGSALSALRVLLMDFTPGMPVAVVTLIVLLVALAISYRDFR